MAKILVCLFISLNAFSFNIISDLDETIKITGHGPRAVLNALRSKKIYLGMNTLFNELEEDKLYVLTASPNQIRQIIFKLFTHNNIDVEQLITRNWFSGQSTFEYKYTEVEKILEQSSEKFILIGDNTSEDEAVYREIKKDYPNHILAIYIRKSKPASEANDGVVNYFYHTIDIALNELKSKRLSHASMLNVLKDFAILKNKYDLIFPSFAYCPITEEELLTPRVLGYSLVVDRINRDLVRHCRD